jgi:hypothetical protein
VANILEGFGGILAAAVEQNFLTAAVMALLASRAAKGGGGDGRAEIFAPIQWRKSNI